MGGSSQIDGIETEVAHLRGLGPAALRGRWRALTGKPAPRHVSAGMLLRLLAYRVQADALGDLSRDTQRLLDRIGQGGAVPLPMTRISTGSELVREWKGTHHRVTTLAQGYAWNGATYASLSEVAYAITGTKWSGPRFFGLKQKAAQADRGAESLR